MRKAFLVYIDLDDAPGEMHSQESAQNTIRYVLNGAIGHYNPVVSLAPAEFQPENVEAGIEVDLKLPQRAYDYILDLQQRKPMGDYDNFDRINLSPEAEQARINNKAFKDLLKDSIADEAAKMTMNAFGMTDTANLKGILNNPDIALDPETTGIEPTKAKVILHPAIAGYLKRNAAERMEPQTPDEAKQRMLETPNMFKVAPGTANYDDREPLTEDRFIDRHEVKLIDPIGDVQLAEDRQAIKERGRTAGLLFDPETREQTYMAETKTVDAEKKDLGYIVETDERGFDYVVSVEDYNETVRYTEENAGLD